MLQRYGFAMRHTIPIYMDFGLKRVFCDKKRKEKFGDDRKKCYICAQKQQK